MYHFPAQNKATILMGSNMGDRVSYMKFAIQALEQSEIKVIQQSSYFESEAWGFDSEPFINQAIVCETVLTPHQLLTLLQIIERKAGRTIKSTNGYAARTLDLDIIFFNHQIVNNTDLTIPHPRIQERKFGLLPLNEIIPQYKHILLQKTIAQLTEECSDSGKVAPYLPVL